MKPFVLRFGDRLDVPPAHALRYDLHRQIGRAFVGGAWIDIVDAREAILPGNTRLTEVKRETTDDE